MTASGAEVRLDELLDTLRDDRPEPSTALTVRVVRQARWQEALRGVLQVAGRFAAAAGGVARLVLRGRA